MPLSPKEELELLQLEEEEFQNGQNAEGPATESQPGKLESLARGAAQGATLGFGDELSGTVEKGIGTLMGNPAYKNISQDQLVQENRIADKAAKEANPKSFGAAELISGMPAAIATSVVGGPVVNGALVGGILTAGKAEGDVADRLDDFAMGATTGAVMGKVVPTALSATGKVLEGSLKYAGQGLKTLAQKLSTKSVQLKDISGLDEKALSKVGDMLLDSQVTNKPAILSVVKKRLERVLRVAGDRVKDEYGILDDKLGLADQVTGEDLLNLVHDKVGFEAKTGSFANTAAQELSDILNAPKWAKTTHFSPSQILKIIQDLESEGQRFTSKITNSELENKKTALIAASKALRGTLKDLASKYFPEEAATFHDALETYTVLKRASNAVNDSIKSSFKTSGGPGISVDQLTRGVTAPFETVAKTTAAGAANFSSKILGYVGEGSAYLKGAAQRGPQALNAATYSLMQRSEDFRKHMLNRDGDESK